MTTTEKNCELYEKIIREKKYTKKRSEIEAAIVENGLAYFLKRVEATKKEFKSRPRLKHVFYITYLSMGVLNSNSLGKGCKVLAVDKNGFVSIEFRQGRYSAIKEY